MSVVEAKGETENDDGNILGDGFVMILFILGIGIGYIVIVRRGSISLSSLCAVRVPRLSPPPFLSPSPSSPLPPVLSSPNSPPGPLAVVSTDE